MSVQLDGMWRVSLYTTHIYINIHVFDLKRILRLWIGKNVMQYKCVF